jgi:hypothetical protein
VLALRGRRCDELLDNLRARRGGAPRRPTSTVRVSAPCRWPNVSVRAFSPPHTPCPWPTATPADAVLDQLPVIAAPCGALALVELLRPA